MFVLSAMIQEVHGMHYWDESNTVCLYNLFFFPFGFVYCRLFSNVKTFFIYCFLDPSLMEGDQENSVEKRALHRTIWSQIPSTSLSLFLCLSTSLSVFHLTPLSPATCPSKPSQSSLYLSLHLLVSPPACSLHFLLSPAPPTLILVMPGLQLLCQCVWLKCSPRRNKICEENFIVSASSFLCSDSFCWSALVETGGLCFIFSLFLSWWFLAPVTMFLSGCFWIKTWQFSLLNYIKSLLGF